MRRILPLFLVFLLFLSGVQLFAQEEDDDETVFDWFDYVASPYSRGDRTFVITVGAIIPTIFPGIENNDHGLRLGGTGSLAFNYFLTSRFFVGGELSAMFESTRRGNMLYIVPFGARIGYQFWTGRFEFPLSVMVGVAPQRYLEKGYFGPAIKPGVSAFWRFNPDFSFGINGLWWVIPQWPRNNNDVIGNYLELSISVRYHF
jgi:hypothetical protein